MSDDLFERLALGIQLDLANVVNVEGLYDNALQLQALGRKIYFGPDSLQWPNWEDQAENSLRMLKEHTTYLEDLVPAYATQDHSSPERVDKLRLALEGHRALAREIADWLQAE